MDYFQELFEKVEPLHNKENQYHNIDHVVELINQLDLLDITYDEYEILYTTICFHDIVYIPGKDNNEQLSAELFLNFKEQSPVVNLEYEFKNIIYNTILSTSPTNFLDKKRCSVMLSNVIDIMHDLDYYYFKDYKTLIEADDKIEKEYLTIVNEETFTKNRILFLVNLLDKDIYLSVFKQNNNEAKENIIKLLNNKYKGWKNEL